MLARSKLLELHGTHFLPTICVPYRKPVAPTARDPMMVGREMQRNQGGIANLGSRNGENMVDFQLVLKPNHRRSFHYYLLWVNIHLACSIVKCLKSVQ